MQVFGVFHINYNYSMLKILMSCKPVRRHPQADAR